jgi:Tol biopolymer transport system component
VNSPASELEEQSVRAALQRILASPEFTQSARMKALLSYLVDGALKGNAGEMKESVIGVDVFRREPGYDPKLDGVVRTEARRLRSKLQEYYCGSGAADPVRIDLPKGAYIPVFIRTEAPPSELPPVAALPAQRRPARWWWLLPVTGVIATSAWLLGTKLPPPAPGVPRQLTSGSGYSRTPTFSLDGSQLAYSADLESQSHIFVRPVEGGAARQMTFGTVCDYEPAWSPDGSQVAFVRQLAKTYQIRRVNLRTGGEQFVAEIAFRAHLDWSPDGAWIATCDRATATAPVSIVAIAIANGARKALISPPAQGAGDIYPAYSPDGKQLAFIRRVDSANGDIYLTDLGSAVPPRQLTFDHGRVEGFSWSPSGDSLVASLQPHNAARSLWRVSLRGGAREHIAEAGVEPMYPAIARKGNRLAWVVTASDTDIWRAPLGGTEGRTESETVVVRSPRRDANPNVSPDGKLLAFRSGRTGFEEIWIADAGGGSPRQVTSFQGAVTSSPRWSPDSKELVFDSRAEGTAHMYRVKASGGSPARLTSGRENEEMPSWSHDGQSIYFGSNRSGQWQVWRLRLATGVLDQVSWAGGGAPLETPDGRYLYYSRGAGQAGLARIPTAGGPEEIVLPDLKPEMWGNWAPGNHGVYYVEWSRGNSPSSIAYRDPTDPAPRTIRTLTKQPIYWDAGLALAPDESAIYYTQFVTGTSEIFVLAPFR